MELERIHIATTDCVTPPVADNVTLCTFSQVFEFVPFHFERAKVNEEITALDPSMVYVYHTGKSTKRVDPPVAGLAKKATDYSISWNGVKGCSLSLTPIELHLFQTQALYYGVVT